jgi:RimJ/RimL family protein N-acetyltransferase
MIFESQLTLSKDNVTLIILNNEHENLLTTLAIEKKIWEHAPEQYYRPEIFKEKWFNKAIAQMEAEERISFVISCNNQIVGSTSYYEINLKHQKTNIGYTWFHPSVWGTKTNALSKLIMLEYVFEILKFNRVGFSVDSLNDRACLALEKIGVKREGILRNHLVLPNNRIRHSVMYSVINDEWAGVKKNIELLI